jgi:CheY-like chemotaxis protein
MPINCIRLRAGFDILCRGLLRTLLLHDGICVTATDGIDEMLTLIPRLPDLDLVLLDASMPGMENFAGLRRLVEKLPDVPVVVTSPSESSVMCRSTATSAETSTARS